MRWQVETWYGDDESFGVGERKKLESLRRGCVGVFILSPTWPHKWP